MPKGSITKELRNGRYNQLRRWGVPRARAKQAMDFSGKRYYDFLCDVILHVKFGQATTP